VALGANVVVHSATKFGHSDLLLGAAAAADPDLAGRLRRRRELTGATPGALETYLALRGIRTLAVRLERGQRSAGELARRLAEHPAVGRVCYPGLPADPGHTRAAAQMSGFGAVLAFELPDAADADAVCTAVRVVTSATSLGGVESTIEGLDVPLSSGAGWWRLHTPVVSGDGPGDLDMVVVAAVSDPATGRSLGWVR